MFEPAAGFPDFDAFYHAVHDRAPFPWQSRLAALAAQGEWPGDVGVPTGLGKTSCLDIAVWSLAAQAHLPAGLRVAPTRIWWLVNRRLLVDATAEHAERLAAILADPDRDEFGAERGEVLRTVGEQLRLLSPNRTVPLEVVKLRGGAAVGRPSSPAQPSILLTTLPMYGSRLLFRGYGSSRSMRPLDAALAGTDALVLVDEAHLAHHLMALFGPIADCDRSCEPVLPGPRARPTVVSLTATGATSGDQRFDLDATDRADPVIARRLAAPKPTKIVLGGTKDDPATLLADQSLELLRAAPRPSSLVVFVNTPDRGRQVHRLIQQAAAGNGPTRVLLLTGRMREREAGRLRQMILDPQTGASSNRSAITRDEHLVVIATQTLEVGADLDFEFLVTEACGVRALTQRLGRLNRLGRFDHSAAVYVHVEPAKNTGLWPVYGQEPAQVLERLQRSASADGIVGLGVDEVRGVLGEPGDDPGYAPKLLPALLWEWVKTTAPPDGEAPVEPYFSGLTAPERTVSICWRAHIPAEGERIWPGIRDDETIDLPLHEARSVFENQSVVTLAADRATVVLCPAERLRPGAVIIAPADCAMADEYGWSAEERRPVVDMAVLRSGLPLDPEVIGRLVGNGRWVSLLQPILTPDDDDDEEQLGSSITALLDELDLAEPLAIPRHEWSAFLARLAGEPEFPREGVPRLRLLDAIEEASIDELDEMSLAPIVTLDAHGRGVGNLAGRIAQHCGLPDDLINAVTLAGNFHDLGKIDARFQRWLDPLARASEPVAKSDRPRSSWSADRFLAGWPRGGRHEALSARLVLEWQAQRSVQNAEANSLLDQLVVHLVISHHGHGRPFLAPAVDTGDRSVTATVDGCPVEVSADLSIPDWDQPDRFLNLNRHYGHWGLALLETIVRQADHALSRTDTTQAVT